jgi:copper(I)-binding protein
MKMKTLFSWTLSGFLAVGAFSLNSTLAYAGQGAHEQSQAGSAAQRIQVEHPWIGAPAPFARALGGFMLLKNPSDQPATLVSASAPGFKMVMLHRSINENGMHRMIHVDEVTIPAKGSLAFKHGSYHIMLIGPQRKFKVGDTVPVTLGFKDGSHKTVTFKVEKRMH